MRVALAGYAYGRTLHAPLLEEAGCQIVAVATSSPERVAQARTDLPDAEVVPELSALLDAAPRVGADVVVLATPTGLHAEHVREVVAAGIPCVVDKPLSVDADTAAALVRQARAARVPLTVFQNRRYDAAPRALAALLSESDGPLGRVRRFEMRYERWRPTPQKRWREERDWRQGGGVLLDLASHVVDAAVHFLGPVRTVFAVVNSYSTPADDDALLTCRHEGGATSVLTASSVTAAPGPRLRVLGERAAYVLDEEDEGFSYPDLRNAPGSAGWVVSGAERRPAPLPPGGQADFYRAVAAALTGAGPADYDARQAALPVDPADAVHTLAVIDAARLSSSGGQSVAVADPLGRG